MFYQSFSFENMQKIFDMENRKGQNLEKRFFPKVAQCSLSISKCREQAKRLRKQINRGINITNYESYLERLQIVEQSIRQRKETYITKDLLNISEKLSKGKFDFDIDTNEANGKKIYIANKDAVSYFALKQVQYNLRKLYKIKQANRQSILCQLKGILESHFPKNIIRTDIKDFYESIDREALITKIKNDSLLTVSTKRIILSILYKYGELSGETKGLPRGIGISAYLAELYMRDFDQEILDMEGVVYYARYVDDIIIIYSLCSDVKHDFKMMDRMNDVIKRYGLEYNTGKTACYDAGNTSQNELSMDYLGYSIQYHLYNKKLYVRFGLSSNKTKRYIKKIKLSIDHFIRDSGAYMKPSASLLIKRVRFLTGNTSLWNHKKTIMIGVYFSNTLLDDTDDFKILDKYLQGKLKLLDRQCNGRFRQMIDRLKKYSFCVGFDRKSYYSFSPSDFKTIVQGWRHVS